jgi:hypothetical protein
VLIAAVAVAGAFATPARAAGSDDPNCLMSDLPALDVPAHGVRFGIAPLAAGSAGTTQGEPAPVDRAKERAALEALRPPHRELVLRLNRMFWADGVAGIRHYAGIVDRYARSGFDTELQVRYHPPEGREGDMRGWKRYVRRAVSILGKRPSVVALSITNEANFPVSPNTSDGSYDGVRRAIVKGTLAAQRRLRKIHRRDIELGFSFAWRWAPDSDRRFWEVLGRLGDRRFRRAVDYVGLQIYPHLVFPPAPRPGHTAGDEVIEALTLLRDCYMPKAGLGHRVDLWVTENGYATNLGRTEASQRHELASTLESVHRYSGTLGISDYRYFNLRDNDSGGTDLFDAVGLLNDGYGVKPAFATLRRHIVAAGTRR